MGSLPVSTRIEGRELRTKKGAKGWTGWTPKSGVEKVTFQELALCPRSDRDQAVPRGKDDDEGLVLPHERLVDAAAAFKATTTASRNRNKFCMPDEIRDISSEAAKCRNPVRKKELRKMAREARRAFEAGRAVLPREKVIHRPVVTKRSVDGRAREDRDEWTEEVRAHCERSCDDEAETPEVQAERIRRQRDSGDRRVALQGRRIRITVDKVLHARRKMMKNKANELADRLVTGMLQCLQTAAVFEVA